MARGLTGEARALLGDGSLTAEQRAEVAGVVTRRQAVDAYHAGRDEESLALVRLLQARSPGETSLAALEAWNLLALGEVSEARAIFAELHPSFPTAETRAGLKAVLGHQYPASTWM